jgi:hypothetical protein
MGLAGLVGWMGILRPGMSDMLGHLIPAWPTKLAWGRASAQRRPSDRGHTPELVYRDTLTRDTPTASRGFVRRRR